MNAVEYTKFLDNLEHVASTNLESAKKIANEKSMGQLLSIMIWGLKHKNEACSFLYDCISEKYVPIILEVPSNTYVALFDYSNPSFAKGVEGTCHINVYDIDGNETNSSRLVYKLTDSYDLNTLIANCLEFTELNKESTKIIDGFGTQLLTKTCDDVGSASNIFR